MLLTKTSPDIYDAQFDEKLANLKARFKPLYEGEWDLARSESSHYRARTEFRIWHDHTGMHYAMFNPGDNRTPVYIDEFDVASLEINSLMPKLLAEMTDSPMLSERLFQVEFLGTTAGDMLVTLVYHKRLDESWDPAAQQLAAKLDIKLIGRSRGVKRVISEDKVIESISVNDRDYRYLQAEGGFSQPNPGVAQQMLEWGVNRADGLGGDLLELYCGNGNFTAPLSTKFNRVLATEISKTSVQLAQENFKLNSVGNVDVVRMSSEEFTQAFNGEREFRRMRGVDLSSFELNTIFVDPPRAGLDDGTRELCSRFENIIYISCSPETLERDLNALTANFEIERMAFFDQFPYTPHAECGALLRRK